MGKNKHQTTGTVMNGGESAVSLLEQYKGRTKLLNTSFPPSWEPDAKAIGEQVLGIFQSVRLVPKGPKVEKEYNSYVFKLQAWKPSALGPVSFTRQDQSVEPTPDMLFSISGKVIDSAMETIKPGEACILIFNGMGTKKKGRNPAKLIEIHALETA